jgi:hypothetical protein
MAPKPDDKPTLADHSDILPDRHAPPVLTWEPPGGLVRAPVRQGDYSKRRRR